jgi:hypothetical protein
MSTLLSFGRDINGFNSFAAPESVDKYSATLTSGGNASITVPGNYENWIVSFSYQPGSDMWVCFNGNAAAPVGGTFATTTSELLPGTRTVSSKTPAGVATTINIYNNTASSQDVGVIFYAVS